MHVSSAKRHKLDSKAEKGIFVGYGSQSKGYRVYNLQTKEVTVSRDIIYDEEDKQDPTNRILPSFNQSEEGTSHKSLDVSNSQENEKSTPVNLRS